MKQNLIEIAFIMLMLTAIASAECIPVFLGLSAAAAVFGFIAWRMSTKEE